MKKLTVLLLFILSVSLQLSAQCSNYSRPGVHVVQSGENLYRISKLYNLSTLELADWNNISPSVTLYACQELVVSNPNTYGNAVAPSNEDVFASRGNNSYDNNTYNNNSFSKQSGNKHTIQPGETIRGLAELYGYTEARFRSINLLQNGEELSVGSVILSSDCACDRITTYDDTNTYRSPSSFGNGNNSYTNGNSFNDRNSTFRNDTYQNRGGDYDSFYDNPQGSIQSNNNPPPAQAISSRTNPNNSNQPSAYDATTNRVGGPAPVAASYMSSEELSMLDEINLMRSNPSGYIPYIEQYKKDIISGKSFGSSIAVCNELIAELRRTPVLSVLKPAPCIYNAAKKHGLDQKNRGSTGHDGSDGSWPWDRVKRECAQMTDGNENLVGGPADVREAVILLLVDDGIPSRGHRKTLLNKDWVYGATYKIGKVGFMPNCWVQKFGY